MSELTGDGLARIVCAFRQSESMEEQFIALGILVELVMRDWPPSLCQIMLTSLERRLGLLDQSLTENVMPN